MADSLNPEDKARLDRLEQGLRGLEGQLGQRLENLRRGVAADQQRIARETARGAHEETVRRQGAGVSTVLPTEAEVRRYGQAEIQAGEAVDRRADAFRRISQLNLQTSQEELNVMGRTQQLLAMERNIGLERARNLQLLQRQAQELGVAIPGQTTRGVRGGATQPGDFGFRPPAPALILPTGQEYTAERKISDQFARIGEKLSRDLGGRTLVPPSFGFGGGGGGVPPRPPAPPGPPEGPDPGRDLRAAIDANKLVDYARRVEDAANANEDLVRAQQKSGAAIDQMNARVAESSRTLAIGSNQLRAHGALTTEFITAAARGQTTFSELGYQVGATIAKFAGWTGAAAAVYAVLGAVQNLGSGAVESLQGVNLLQRVINNLDTDRAQRDFRSLAQEFNLPMSEVVKTSYEASKAFKDQADATEATRAALFAVKVGELDAGKAGQFATAVARGFHLEAKQLGDVINTVNALQNRFGGNFGQIAQGMAQASGAFGAARGNYQELAAAIATISQTTGIPGSNAATALRRTSELAFRPERRQNILDVLGIDTRDASTSIADLLDAAMALVAKGRNPLEVAKLITTPELASRAIAPLLAGGALYQQRLEVAQHPGPSSERELRRARASIRDQISMIGNQIEQIGSNLGQAGALNALGLMLKTINETLRLTNNLLDAFNTLPKPVREAAIYFGQIAAALAVMRRFDVGRTVGTRFPFAGEQLARRDVPAARAQILKGLDDERKWLQEQTQAVGRQRALSELQAVRAAQRHDRNVDLHAAGRLSDDELVASMQRRDRFIAQAKGLAEDQSDLQERTNENLRQEAALRERTNFRNRASIRTLEDLDRIAAEQGIQYKSTLDRNVPLSATRLGQRGTRIVDEDPERVRRAMEVEAARRPPIDWRQASGRVDAGAYHRAAEEELRRARQAAREAGAARERFDALPGGRFADPEERERLVREEQRHRAEVERAFQRAEEARRGYVPTGRPAFPNLDEWAREHATGEPIPMPVGAGVPPVEEAVKDTAAKAEEVAQKQNTLRRGIADATRAAEGMTGNSGRLSRTLGTAGGVFLTAGRGAASIGTGLAAFGRNLAASIDPLTGVIAGLLILQASYSYIRQKTQETSRKVADLRNVGSKSVEQIRRDSQRELNQRSPFEAIQDAYASYHNFFADTGIPGLGKHIDSPNQQRDAAARQSARFADEIEKGNRVGLYLTRGQITERLNERLRTAGDDQTKIAQAFADAAKESQTARGLFYGSGDDGAPTGDELKRAAKNMDNFRLALKARLAGLKAVTENIDEALKLAVDSDALNAILQATQTNIALYGFTPSRAGDLGKIRARAVEVLAALDRGDPDYEANRQKQVAIIQGTADEASKRANERLARSLPYVDVEVAGRLRETQISNMRRTLIGGTDRQIDVVTQRMLRRRRQINVLHDDLKTPDPDPLRGAAALGAGTIGQMPQVLKTEDEKRRRYRALKAAQEGDRKRLEELRKSLKMSRDEFQDFMRAQELAQFQAEQAAFEATTGLLQSRTPDSSEDLRIAARRAQQELDSARAYRAAHGGPRAIVQQAEQKRNEANQALAQDVLRDAQANDQLATARAEAGGLKDKGLLQRQLSDAQRNAQRVKAAVDRGEIDPDAYRDALLNVYQAQTALNNFIQQNADSLLNALEALALSKTEDPNKQARIRVDYARKRLAEALKTGTKEQQITAQADLNNRIRERRNTAQQERFDDIEFMAQMGQIGKSTEIAMLNQLLSTMHGNRQLRRQIKQRIHDLQSATNSLDSGDLELGNIRLPTPYEVNRAIKEGGRASRGGHTFNSRSTVNVYVARPEDTPAVARAIDRTLNTHVASVLRTRTG